MGRSATTQLTDLFMVDTSTTVGQPPIALNMMRTSYPAGDAFSADSAYVNWYQNVDGNSRLGDLMTRSVTANGTPMMLASLALAGRNYRDPNGIFILANGVTQMQGTSLVIFSSDLGVAKRDGTGTFNLLVSSVDPSEFSILPHSKSKVIYLINTGFYQGLWIRPLPDAQ
jgi:hypothetical protein